MNKIMLFTDGSLNTKSKTGYGAYLAVSNLKTPIEILANEVHVKHFNNTSSTKLELQTLLWAINAIKPIYEKLVIYNDSQNIISLQNRRERLEQNNFRTRKNINIKNHILYKKFYRTVDQFNCEFIKVQGHKASKLKNDVERIFTLVDRASRSALREDYK